MSQVKNKFEEHESGRNERRAKLIFLLLSENTFSTEIAHGKHTPQSLFCCKSLLSNEAKGTF